MSLNKEQIEAFLTTLMQKYEAKFYYSRVNNTTVGEIYSCKIKGGFIF